MCLEIADLLDTQGISTTVVDPRWVKPVDEALAPLAERHRVVVTVEDNGRAGGVGSAVAQALRDAGVDVPLRDFGIPPRFLDHASRKEVMAEIGLTAPDIARQVTGLVAKLDGRYDSDAGRRPSTSPDAPTRRRHGRIGAGCTHPYGRRDRPIRVECARAGAYPYAPSSIMSRSSVGEARTVNSTCSGPRRWSSRSGTPRSRSTRSRSPCPPWT